MTKTLVDKIEDLIPAHATPIDRLAVAGHIAANALSDLPYEDRLTEFSTFFLILFEHAAEREKGAICH